MAEADQQAMIGIVRLARPGVLLISRTAQYLTRVGLTFVERGRWHGPGAHRGVTGVLTVPSVLFLLTSLLWATPAHAQFRAGIQGTVVDPSPAPVPGATVVITNEDTGVVRETVTGDAGFYRVAGLSPGRYKVVASLTGFKETVMEHVEVGAEEIRGLDLQLQAGGVQENVTVTAEPQTLQAQNAG